MDIYMDEDSFTICVVTSTHPSPICARGCSQGTGISERSARLGSWCVKVCGTCLKGRDGGMHEAAGHQQGADGGQTCLNSEPQTLDPGIGTCRLPLGVVQSVRRAFRTCLTGHAVGVQLRSKLAWKAETATDMKL